MALTDNLIGHWKFDESIGLVAADSSTQGNDGNLTNMDNTNHVPGYINNALQFDGINERVLFGDILDGILAGDATLQATFSAWILPSTKNTNRVILSKWPQGAVATRAFNMSVFSSAAGTPNQPFFSLSSDGTNATQVSTTSSVAVAMDVWSFVLAEVDLTQAGDGRIQIYVNNINTSQALVDAGFGGSITSAAGEISVGALYNLGNDFLGTIDDVRIWNRLLTDAEKTSLFTLSYLQSDRNRFIRRKRFKQGFSNTGGL